jgi:hypothetical protein
MQKLGHRVLQLAGQLAESGVNVQAAPGECLRQRPVARASIGEPVDEPEQPVSVVIGVGESHQRRDPVLEYGLKQRFLRRKMPVDRSGPDAGRTRDVVDRHEQPVASKSIPRGSEHPFAVARCVGANHYCLLAKRGARSVYSGRPFRITPYGGYPRAHLT